MMNEMAKTLSFIGGAIVISAIAYWTQPRIITDIPSEIVSGPLFASFEDPYEAKSLEIVRFDEGLGQLSTFEVAQKANERWVIPSHNDYPADAEDRLKDSATALVDLNIIRVIEGATTADHEEFGVIEPDDEKIHVGQQGVGTLVEMRDEKSKPLASIIIGKEVKDTEGQRYVRVRGRPAIYVVEIDPEKFSTKFRDWIEKDLLQLSSFDIQQVVLNDYTTDPQLTLQGFRVNYDQKLKVTLTWDSDESDWKLDEFQEFQGGQLNESQLADDEELNKDSLNELKNSLDDLEIVDVDRKPEGLGEDLRAGKGFVQDNEAGIQSLFDKGFFPVPAENSDEIELLCKDGEVIVRTKDAVEYVLRFGSAVASLEEASEEEESKINRYVFVSARVHEKGLPYPELEALPGEDGDVSPPPPLESASGFDQLTGNAAGEVEAAAQGEQQETVGNAQESTDDVANSQESLQTAADETAADDDEAAEPANESDDGNDGTVSEAQPAESTQSDDGTNSESESEEDQLKAERERIQKENKRKLDEYEEKRKQAEEKVRELNYRFADWYYIVSEDIYKKIRLGRGEIIKKKEPAEDENGTTDEDAASESPTGLDALEQFEQDGLAPDE